jgi:arylsulfatase A-like enzyme
VDSARGLPADRKLLSPVAEPNLRHEETTLAEVMQTAGYRTALVGKWHLGTAEYGAETQGFEVNIGGTHWGAPATFFYPYRGNQRFRGEYRYVPGLGFGKPGDYLTDRLTDVAMETIDRAAGDPFFLFLSHHAPHTPIEAPEALVAKYRAKLRPGMHHSNATYAAMVEAFDTSVGRVREHLRVRGLDRNTAVIVMSDNGGFINESEGRQVTSNAPLRSGKGALYEGGLRVPLLIYWPGVTSPGMTIDEPVVSTDLFRTVTEMAGARTASAHPDGLSLVPLLRGASRRLPDREAIYFHYPHYYPTTTPASAIRTRKWKLIEFHEDGVLELYDLENDPSEQRNLAVSQPAASQPAVVADLREKLDAWKADVKARLPRPNPVWRPGC